MSTQIYIPKRLIVPFILLFSFLLIFALSCKEENSDNSSENTYMDDYVSPKQKWGFINKSGKYIINPKYDDLRDFENGLAAASYEGKWGFIDEKGNAQIPFDYLTIEDFSDGLSLVTDFEGSKFYINGNNEKIINCPYETCFSFKNNKARVIDNGITFFINKSGQILENSRYSSATDFKNGVAVVNVGELYGIVDTNCNIVIPVKYDQIKFNEDIAVLKKNNNYKFVTLPQQEFLQDSFEKASVFVDGYAIVKKENTWGIVDRGLKFTSLSDEKVRYLNDNRWAVKFDGKYIIKNENGDVVTYEAYDNLYEYHCGIIGVQQGEAWGYIDIDGKEVLRPQLPLIWDCSEDIIRIITNGGYAYIDKDTEVIIAPKFLEARDFRNGKARVQEF